MILSNLYSSSVPISSNGGCGKLGLCSRVFLYDDRRKVWNMLWIFYCFGSFSQKVMEDMTCVISKGPVCLAESFLEGTWSLRFLVSSHTLSLTFQGLKWEKVCSFMYCCASLWVASASFCASSIWLSYCLRAGKKVLPRSGCYRCLEPPTFFSHFILPTIPLPMEHDNQQQRDLLRDLGPVHR